MFTATSDYLNQRCRSLAEVLQARASMPTKGVGALYPALATITGVSVPA
jgi:hypothetical protein